ncbi:MAG: hypothetical protein HIU88_10555 [Acidobacteria bacterium]|nr:hypothetical protein [Acidobacteriota bacterium]
MPESEEQVPEEASQPLPDADSAPERRSRSAQPGRARRAAVVGLRVAAGTIGIAAAVAVIAAVGLVPLPSRSIAAPVVVVTPQPGEQTRVCAGGLFRLGDQTGQNASTLSSIGAPSVTADTGDTAVRTSHLGTSDGGTGGTAAAPSVVTLPDKAGTRLSAAQSQLAQQQDYSGFAAASCAEPSSSIWLVGGSTTVGRTTLVTLGNASAVDATVALTILSPNGPVNAPGMSGILVKSGEQRIISLAGFAPNLASPVVHVEARGGQITAYLQQSIVRGLDAGGVDIVNPGSEPATRVVIPGIRVVNAVGLGSALALSNWEDAVAAVRVAVPGTRSAKVHVSLVPQNAQPTGVSFEMDVAAGQVNELPLDSGAQTDTGRVTIPDGDYTVVLSSDQPIVGGARVSTVSAAASGASAPASDFAWYASAAALTGNTAVTIAPGASPELSATNSGTTPVTLVLTSQGGADLTLTVPAGVSATIPVTAGATYVLSGAKGLVVGISYAGDAVLAAYPVVSPRPVSGAIIVHP